MYDPTNWYWRADDDRLYSSARQSLIESDDSAFLAWVADGRRATRWPVDADGEQTDAALQDVLAPHGLTLWPVPLKEKLTAYAAAARWQKEIGGIVVGGAPIATDDRSKQMIIGARLAADADPAWTTQWVGADGSVHPVNAAAMIAISDAVQAHVNACFVTYASVKSAIDAGDITTTEEIDDAFA